MSTLPVILILAAIGSYAAWVTALVGLSTALKREQKVAQCALIWFLAPLGTLVVHLINQAQEREFGRCDFSGIDPQADQGVSPRDFSGPSHD